MDLSDILVALVGGTCLGVLAKAAFPGDRGRIPLWLVVVCGVAGGVGGAYAYRLFFEASPASTDWWRHLWQFATAVGLVVLAARLTGRPRA